MPRERERVKPESVEGRILLDSDGKVVEADPAAYSAFGLDEEAPAPEDLGSRMSAAGLLPGPESPSAWFRRVSLTGAWDDVIETAFCRAPGGGWTVAIHHLRGQDVKRGGFQSLAAFLATTSHELNTPLTALKGSLQLLERRAGPEDRAQRALLEMALRGVNRLIRLVANIVDNMRISSQTLDLQLDSVDPEELVEEAVALATPRTAGREVLVLKPDPPPPAVLGDRERLREIVVELLDNAAKCSEEGSRIEVSVRGDGDSVVFTVSDQGRGIDPEHQEAVFRPFYQVDGSATRDIPGLGLGLAVSKGVVDLHGGSIWVDDVPGPGSRLSFRIPAARGKPGPGAGSEADGE